MALVQERQICRPASTEACCIVVGQGNPGTNVSQFWFAISGTYTFQGDYELATPRTAVEAMAQSR